MGRLHCPKDKLCGMIEPFFLGREKEFAKTRLLAGLEKMPNQRVEGISFQEFPKG
jgi:hypothetical protein